jgi:hypothetical protein
MSSSSITCTFLRTIFCLTGRHRKIVAVLSASQGSNAPDHIEAEQDKQAADDRVNPVSQSAASGYPLDSPHPNLLCRLLCGFGAADYRIVGLR